MRMILPSPYPNLNKNSNIPALALNSEPQGSNANVLPVHITPPSIVNVESEVSELVGKSVSTLEEAYDLYNEYSFKFGFGVRKSRNRMRADKTLGLRGKEFCCCREGFKRERGQDNKQYTKLDTRTGCRAMVYFELDNKSNVWKVREHIMEHNHAFVLPDQRHLIKSHKKRNEKELEFLNVLRSSGFNIANGVRLLAREAGGCINSSSVGDSIWRLQMKRKFDSLINLSDKSESTKAYIEDIYERAKIFVEIGSTTKESCSANISSEKGDSTVKIEEQEENRCYEGIGNEQIEAMSSEPMCVHSSETSFLVQETRIQENKEFSPDQLHFHSSDGTSSAGTDHLTKEVDVE